MSGPRMGNMGQMNGNRRPNISRMGGYHENRSYEYRQSYQDNRQSSHEGRHEVRHHDHRSHSNPQNSAAAAAAAGAVAAAAGAAAAVAGAAAATAPTNNTHSQHDELVKFVHDSWTKVESEGANVPYYQEQENHILKDFQPFNLEAYWGRKVHQNHQHQS